MYMYLIQVRPTRNARRANGAAGAFVNCWIDFKNSRVGQRLAEILIEDAGWEVVSKRPKCWEFKGLREVRPKDRLYFREAKLKGSSLVFNVWSNTKTMKQKK